MFFSHQRSRLTAAALAAITLCLVGGARESSAAMMFSVSDGGVVDAAGCMAASCGSSQTFADTLAGFASVSGTIHILIDPVGATLDLSLQLEDAIGLLALGGPDNGVMAIDFSGVIYSASGLSLIEVIPGVKYIIGAGETASIEGSYSQDAGAGANFDLDIARITGTCDVVGATVTCGFAFGTTDFSLGVGAAAESRYFRHTLNVTGIVPEPSTGLLLGAGLVILALRRR